jgi:hypothetical protein
MPVAGSIARIGERLVSIARSWRATFGGGSRPPPTERDHVRNFLDFLDDRRVLYTPYFLEYPAHVVESVCQIEIEAGAALAVLSRESRASLPISRVRGACSAFLGRAEIAKARASGATIPGEVLFFAVVALRKSLAAEVTALASDFAVDLPRELALISCRAEQA